MTEAKKTTTTKKTAVKKFDRLGKNETWTFKDKNGKEWKYQLQFPGIRKTMEIFDKVVQANGQTSMAKSMEEYLKYVVVEPSGLTLDDFDERPGVMELYQACDQFLGSRLD